MEPVKIVIRYADGRLIKGYTNDFSPKKSSFHLCPVTDCLDDRHEISALVPPSVSLSSLIPLSRGLDSPLDCTP
ncbi:MAG: hypothetical protein M1508_02270 [Nitrospirae bacterium]|nr:hypothetical protein [Nitrospirota bacterium]